MTMTNWMAQTETGTGSVPLARYEDGRTPHRIVRSRHGCHLPNEWILKPEEGTISKAEFDRRQAARIAE